MSAACADYQRHEQELANKLVEYFRTHGDPGVNTFIFLFAGDAVIESMFMNILLNDKERTVRKVVLIDYAYPYWDAKHKAEVAEQFDNVLDVVDVLFMTFEEALMWLAIEQLSEGDVFCVGVNPQFSSIVGNILTASDEDIASICGVHVDLKHIRHRYPSSPKELCNYLFAGHHSKKFPDADVLERLDMMCSGCLDEDDRELWWRQVCHADDSCMLRRWLVYNAVNEDAKDAVGHFYYICLGVLKAPIVIAWRESCNIFSTDPSVVDDLVPKLDFLDIYPLVNIDPR